MPRFDPIVTAVLLARGFAEIYDAAVARGDAVRQDASMPPVARRALSLLSGLCLESGRSEDLGASVRRQSEPAGPRAPRPRYR
jgi:hypothetical protein